MIKIVPYRNKSILLKNDKAFVLKESVNTSELLDTSKINIDADNTFDTIEEAIDAVDKEYFDEYELPTVVYQVITNPGESDEHIEELTDLYLAQELFDGSKIDPDPSYKLIKLVKFDYDQDSEEILDFVDFKEDKSDVKESVASDDRDEGATSRDFDALGRLANIKRKIEATYDDFNERADVDSLKYNLKIIQTDIIQLLKRFE